MTFGGLITILQQTQPSRPGGSFITILIPFIIAFAIFYVMIILRLRRKQKRHQEMVDSSNQAIRSSFLVENTRWKTGHTKQ
jgi:large-conductance mechanosensitive channel